ncbi:MAG: hypothetical protein INF43_04430 [Alphaproteobacteria bacterium]|nr:hypothetical protein [Alphaproteobacteria bacterium]
MKPRLLPLLALAAAWLGAMASPLAQGTGAIDAAQGLYDAPSDYQSTDSGLGIPSGLLGLGLSAGEPSAFKELLPPNAPKASDIQGCGTVGIDDYTGQLFNNTAIFEKFRSQDVNSDLAKQLLTYNYSMPQTAALFAQLNQFGNDRYRQFQQGCALSSQQADARRQYVQECVGDVLKSSTIIQDQSLQAGSGASAPSAEELQARKVARAYELCSLQYSSESRVVLKQKVESYAESLRKAQDVNRMLRPLLCPNARPLGSVNAAQAAACWPNLFLPQVRLQAEGVTTNNPTTDFGVKAAPLSVSAFLDGLRSSVGGQFQDLVLTPFRQSIVVVEQASLNQAAEVASRAISAAPPVPDNRMREFTVDYLNCKNPDITLALKEYGKALEQTGTAPPQGPTPSGTPLGFTPAAYGPSETQVIANKMLTGTITDEAIQADRTDLASLLDIAAGCAVNQQIPFLDPVLLANLNSCKTDDQNAFFTMAAYDVAVTGTRNVLNYTRSQLQTALGRLEAGDQTSLLALQTNNQIPDSPAIRERLAAAIRTIMLPHITQQLARLDEFEATRGAFGKRVSQIYVNKQGCLFNN